MIARQWYEFYCTVNTSVTATTARFKVTFLFNGHPSDDVPPAVATVDSPTVTLHERYLNRKIGQVVSVWSKTEGSCDYCLGIEVK